MQPTLRQAGASRLMKPSAPAPSLHRATSTSRPVVLARDVKQGREYREADDTLIEADGKKSKPEAVYADEVLAQQAAAPKKPGNLSKEMKARLREEYIGLGGTANQASVPMPMRAVIAAGLLVEEEARTSTGSSASSSSSSSSGVKAAGSKFVIDENELLTSTTEHRLLTWGPIALMGATLMQAANQVHSPLDAAVLGISVLVAYVLSDLGTGVYHFGVDNYGGPETPVFGRQIAAFQGHHQRPWTITQREFCNNVHQVFKPAGAPAALFLLMSGFMPLWWNGFASSFLFLICMSQQFHAWSHMKKSELPGVVVALQDAGVLISRKQHGAHHKPPFCNNYCIVSGLWNEVLDSSGFFTTLEKVIHERTGVAPRSWNEPEYNGWNELQAVGTSTTDDE